MKNEQVKVSLLGSVEAIKRLQKTNCILTKFIDENERLEGSDWDKTVWDKNV